MHRHMEVRSILVLHRFVNHDFLNQSIQKFGGQFRSTLFLRGIAFLITGVKQSFQQFFFVLLYLFIPVLQSGKYIRVKHIIADVVHGTLSCPLSVLTAMVVAVRALVLERNIGLLAVYAVTDIKQTPAYIHSFLFKYFRIFIISVTCLFIL